MEGVVIIKRIHGHASPYTFKKDGTLRKAYQVPKTLGILPRGVNSVIDKAGVIRHVFSAAFLGERHVAEALEVVRALVREGREREGTERS